MAMNLNEDATLTLKANTRDFTNEMSQLDAKAKELRNTLKEIEKTGAGKGSDEWKKYKAELAGVNTELAKTRKETDLTKLTYGQLGNLVGQLNRDLKGLVPGTDDFNAAVKRLDAARKQFAEVNKQVTDIKDASEELGEPSIWEKIADGAGLIAKVFSAIMALEFVGFILEVGKGIFDITGKFEKYEKVLTTALGSEKLAKQSMAAIKDMASKTVFSVDELTEGYVKLVNRGMRPSQKEMIAMTDLAASQGKTFDDLVEAALDAQTGEFERLKEFGIRGSKSGDQVTLSFKGMNQTVKNTPEALQGAITKFGEMNGVAGQNAKMMETLDGQLSNLGDNFDAMKVAVGEGLRPVFVWLLSALSTGVSWFLAVWKASDPVLKVFGDLFDAVGALAGSFMPIIQRIFPNMISGGTLLSGVMKGIGLAFRAMIMPFQAGIAIMIAFGQSIGGIMQAGKALELLLSGDLPGAAAAFGKAKETFGQVGATAKQNFNAISDGWKNAMVDTPTKVQPAAVFAATETVKKQQTGMTDEQKKGLKERQAEAEKARKKEEVDHKKHLEDVQKANQKALEDLAKIEADAHVASIKDEMQREFAKLGAVRDARAEDIMRSLASEDLKNKQIAALDEKLQLDVTRVAGEYAEKKRKKAEDEEKKRLDAQKGIIEQERQAENALLDWKELMAKGNATKLNAIHKERATIQYNATVEKLNAEEAAETAKANREITDKEQLDRALTAIEGKYHNERLLGEKKHADEVEKINKELQEKKKAAWGNASSAFSALLKGDLNAFVEHAAKIGEGERKGWQKKLEGDMAGYEAAGQMAIAAVGFLNQLAQKKAEKAIAEARRERDEKVAILNDALDKEKLGIEQTVEKINQTKEQASAKIKDIKEQEESKIRDLEKLYSDMSNSESKADLSAEIARTNEESTTKIAAANKTATEAIAAAQEEKTEKINAAETTRDAEIASIEKRTDLDSATRKKMIAESKARAEGEIKQATDEADKKMKLSKDEAAAKTKDAKEEAESKIKLMKELQTADKDRAKELIDNAKKEADEKVKTAEAEKAAKLKLLEQEKATRIQSKKDLERSIADEDAKAKKTEAAAKQKAWQAQQKADIASALITGALATLKALASGFWPVNIVFAAATAVMTGIQIAMIKRQPMPQFEQGGFIPQGGRHASTYGKGGIGLIDRQTGRDVGEMEGGEAIISREQTQANLPLIRRMFANARTSSRRNQPVTSDRDALGRPAGFREGGLFEPAVWKRDMFRYGGIPRLPRRYEDGGISDDTGGGSGGGIGEEEARASGEEAKKQGAEQLKLLGEIRDGVTKSAADTRQAIQTLDSNLRLVIQTGADAQRTATANQSTAVTAAISRQSTEVRSGLTDVKNTTKSAIDGLNRNIVMAFQQSQGRKAVDSDRLVDELRNQTSRLGLGLQMIIQDSTNKTVNAIGKGASDTVLTIKQGDLTNQLVLNSLALKTVTSLKSLEVVTDTSLRDLQVATVQALDTLNQNTSKGLRDLGSLTDAALKRSADRQAASVDSLSIEVRSLKGSINAVEGAVYQVRGAVNGVEGAVWGSNQSGRLDALIGAISVFGKK